MPNVGNNAQAIASQIEWTRPELEPLMLMSSVLWKRINTRTDVKPVSNRPCRIPFQPATGGLFRVANFDGGDLGRGSGPAEVPGYLSCVSFLQATEYTALADYATDSDSKAVQNYVKLTQEQASKTFAGYLDSLVSTGAGANLLDTIVSTTTNGLVVNNANYFQDNQILDVFTAANPPVFVATIQIQSVDIANNTIWLTGAVPAGVVGGTGLYVSGSSAQSNSGLFGLRAYQVAGNAGLYMGIPRSSWPGKFSTPNINLGGKALTPAIVRALQANQILALGDDNDGADNVAHCNVDMQSAWENNALLTQRVYVDKSGAGSPDMLAKKPLTSIAGREMIVNVRATPGLIDFLALKTWFRIETKATDYYEVGGQTIFPAYGGSGGLASSMLFYLVIMCNVGNGQPRMGAYMNNIAVPTGIFGH
jgi:hypothetical protein